MQDKLMLAAMAELGALRRVLVHAVALRLMEEPAPLSALETIEAMLTAMPTTPPSQNAEMDPAVSDLLAALTDERTESIMSDIRLRVAVAAA